MGGTRALVLGGGGVTGIAWEVGVLTAWADSGLDPAAADRIVGTSAGAIVGAALALGGTPQALAGRLDALETPGRFDPGVVGPLLVAQVVRDRERALRRLGRRVARRARLSEDDFVARVAGFAVGAPWPASLVVAVVDASTGRGAALDASSGVDLARAVAASSAVPGVFPPVRLRGRPHLDGGLRSPANADLAAACDSVLVLTPAPWALRRERRPVDQLRALGEGVAWLLVQPDAASRRAIGRDPLDAGRIPQALAAGRTQGRALARRARNVWEPAADVAGWPRARRSGAREGAP